MKSVLLALQEARLVNVRRRDGVAVVGLQLAASSFELLGLVSFVPIFQYLNAAGDVPSLVKELAYWRSLADSCAWLGIELNLAVLLLVTFSLMIVRQSLTLSRTLFEYSSRETASARLRAALFEKFLWADSGYQDRVSGGAMVADLTFNAQRSISHIYGRFGLATQLTICAVYLVGAVLLDPSMTMLLLGVIAISGLVAAPQILKARRLGRDVVSANTGFTEFIVERLKLARLVRLTRMEEVETTAIRRLSVAQRDASYSVLRALAVVDATLEAIAIAVGLTIIYIAVSFLGARVEVVGIFLTMLLRLLPVIRQVAQTKQAVDASRAAFDTIVARLHGLTQARESVGGRKAFAGAKRSISFQSVNCTYASRPDAPALFGVILEIPCGATTAIVGPSGAGKSTLVDLLPRLRQPVKGRILIDGQDIAEIELRSLRNAIAFVSQTPLIFDVPLAEHIRYGAPDASMDDVKRAAWLSGASDFIESLPEGYDTRAGEGGKMLSGGQRQRLDLARGLLSKAPILILDEPTTGLDAESARHLHSAIDRIRSETDTTIIIISHDLESVRDVDQIVVMNAGRVEAVGRHSDLIAKEGWYSTALRPLGMKSVKPTEPAH